MMPSARSGILSCFSPAGAVAKALSAHEIGHGLKMSARRNRANAAMIHGQDLGTLANAIQQPAISSITKAGSSAAE